MRLDMLRTAGGVLVAVTWACAGTGSSTFAAQAVNVPVGCYRFDRPLGPPAFGSGESGWWTFELQPDGQLHRPDLTAAGQRMWVRQSRWTQLADTVWVQLSTGLQGWRVKLAPVSSDTLTGIAQYLTDVIVVGREPLRVPVVAVREPCPRTTAEADAQHLEHLNRELIESVILRKDTTLWSDVALQQLLVVPPGGILENRTEAFAGVRAFFDVQALTLVTDSIAIHDNTAVLVGRLTLDREVRSVGRLGPLRLMAVFVRTDTGWKLLARSLTPCVERAVQAGRC